MIRKVPDGLDRTPTAKARGPQQGSGRLPAEAVLTGVCRLPKAVDAEGHRHTQALLLAMRFALPEGNLATCLLRPLKMLLLDPVAHFWEILQKK